MIKLRDKKCHVKHKFIKKCCVQDVKRCVQDKSNIFFSLCDSMRSSQVIKIWKDLEGLND